MSEMDEMRSMNKKPIAEAKSNKTLSGAGAPAKKKGWSGEELRANKEKVDARNKSLRAKAEAARKKK